MDALHERAFTAAHDGVLRIEFAAPGCRSRRVVSRSNTRPTGRFPSFRMGRSLCWDSAAELNCFRLLDCNPLVTYFAEQPCVIHYQLQGQGHRHVPDCLVRTQGLQALWEVKTAADARAEEVERRTQLLAEHLPRHGYEYKVVLAEELRREPRLRNARFLLRHGRKPLTFEERDGWRRLFIARTSLAFGDVLSGLLTGLRLNVACRLVLEGVLHLDLDQRLEDSLLACTPGTAFGGRTGG